MTGLERSVNFSRSGKSRFKHLPSGPVTTAGQAAPGCPIDSPGHRPAAGRPTGHIPPPEPQKTGKPLLSHLDCPCAVHSAGRALRDSRDLLANFPRIRPNRLQPRRSFHEPGGWRN